MVDSLAGLATTQKAQNVQSQIAVAVLRQVQDQQKVAAEGLLKMIQQTPSASGTGQRVDISV